MSIKLTLQINSLPALEEIMKGSDTEVSVEVRQAVAVAFAEKWLKPLAENPMFQKAIHDLRNEMNGALDKAAASAIGSLSRYSDGQVAKISLNDDWRRHIKEKVAEECDQVLKRVLYPEFKKAYDQRDQQIQQALETLNIPDMVAKITEVAVAEAKKLIVKQLGT